MTAAYIRWLLMEKLREAISFRLEPEFFELLSAQAVKEGRSASACARGLLIRALTDPEPTELRNELKEVKDELDKAQKELRKVRGD